jgi:uncharacterized membrane protein HdeD (DUF308 family)
MTDLIGSTIFSTVIIPFATIVLGVFLKAVNRNDRHYALKKEDFAIGFDLTLGAIFAFTVHSTVDRHNHLEDRPEHLILLIWLFGLWAVSTVVRKAGWKKPDEHTWVCGLIIPNLFGIASIVFAASWISQ